MGAAAHMMERRASVGNRLLAALPSEDLALLAPHLEKVSLAQDAVVARSGDRRDHVYFPHSGAISCPMIRRSSAAMPVEHTG